MPAEVILTCCGNSHPFLERRIILSEAVKIGRSVAQARPSDTNGIFDCKVLSRNHALIWHDNGKVTFFVLLSSNLVHSYIFLILNIHLTEIFIE